jgi:hypothetical protein
MPEDTSGQTNASVTQTASLLRRQRKHFNDNAARQQAKQVAQQYQEAANDAAIRIEDKGSPWLN